MMMIFEKYATFVKVTFFVQCKTWWILEVFGFMGVTNEPQGLGT
jgi:hypothetical protein